MIRSYHNFKLKEIKGGANKKTKHGLILLNQEVKPKRWIYDCKDCDSQLSLQEFMKDSEVNREIMKIYPQFKCITPDTKRL